MLHAAVRNLECECLTDTEDSESEEICRKLDDFGYFVTWDHSEIKMTRKLSSSHLVGVFNVGENQRERNRGP